MRINDDTQHWNVQRDSTSWRTISRDGTGATDTGVHRLIYVSYFGFYMSLRNIRAYANIHILCVGFYPDASAEPSSSFRPGTKHSLNTLTNLPRNICWFTFICYTGFVSSTFVPDNEGFYNTRFTKGHKPSNHIRTRIKSHVYTTE